eukprot:SAG31_NODE_9638_length_1247_cov_60.980836_2_plen_124_part_01
MVAGSKLAVSISSPDGSKVNPSGRLRLYGEVPGETDLTYLWAASIFDADSTDVADAEAVYLETTTGLTRPNLVLVPNQLLPHRKYIFRLTAASRFTDGISAVEVTVNGPPTGGAIQVRPRSGVA